MLKLKMAGLLKLVRTLPKVLKYLPTDKAQDARQFIMSFQVRPFLHAPSLSDSRVLVG